MPYTADLLYNGSRLGKEPEKSSRALGAETDDAAITEAERMLRSSRIVAGVEGGEPPAAGVISKDGQEFVCCIVNQPTDATPHAATDVS